MLLRLPTAQRPTSAWSTMKARSIVPFWRIARCTLENRFDSTLRTLSRDCFWTPGQDAQERVRYATECWFGILDREHVSSSLREEWKYTLSHVRRQPNCNDIRWFNPSPVALCKRCSEPRWLYVTSLHVGRLAHTLNLACGKALKITSASHLCCSWNSQRKAEAFATTRT